MAITPLQLVATDGNAGDTLSYSATGLPAGLTISASGLITGTPTTAGANTVTATVSDGRGGSDSETFSRTIAEALDTIPPSVPGNLTVTSTTTTSISIAWNASSDAGGSGLAGCRVYRDGVATPFATVTGPNFSDTGLIDGTSHAYWVTAYDLAGNEFAAAVPATGTARDIEAPTSPSGLSASGVTTPSALLTWQPSTDTGGSGLAGYLLFRDGVLIATVSDTFYTDDSLARGSRYRFTVAAVDGAGNQSGTSGQAMVNTKRK